MTLDYDKLRASIRKMKRWHKLYKLLKEELTVLGYWKLKSRGNPRKGYKTGFGKSKGEV